MMRKSSGEKATVQHAYVYTVDSITCHGFDCIDTILGSVQGYRWLRSKTMKKEPKQDSLKFLFEQNSLNVKLKPDNSIQDRLEQDKHLKEWFCLRPLICTYYLGYLF